jgi:hypothetical protein
MASKGQLVPHSIRKTKKPLVSVVSEKIVEQVAPVPIEKCTPTHLIVCEPEQDPKYIVVQIHLPLLVFLFKCRMILSVLIWMLKKKDCC